MRRLLRRSVLVIAVSLISAIGRSDLAPRDSTQADATVVPLLDLSAMPESAITVARAALTSRSAPSLRFPYVPEPEYITSPTNYWAGRDGASIDYIVIHYTDISYARTLRAFSNLASDVSAHYVIRGDGHIAQIVAEGDTAWHSGNAWYNRHSIGIELELDRVTNPVFTTEQYYAGASLVCAISARQDVPLDRDHVIGHNEVPGTTHTDPGPTWDWPHFMWLTSLCAPPTSATVHARLVSETPYPEITARDKALLSVVLRNTGSTAWRKGTDQEARLGIPDNSQALAFLADGWPAPERPAVQEEEIVPPGGTATLPFRVKGALPGTCGAPPRR